MRVNRTIWGEVSLTNKMAGTTYTPPVNSTLNDVLNISATATASENKLGYFTIGLTPIDQVTASGFGLTDLRHNPFDTKNFIPIPVFMKDSSIALTTSELTSYRLFKTETHGGVEYNVAYAKPFASISSTNDLLKISYTDASGYNKSDFNTLTIDFNNPTPIASLDSYPSSIDYIAHSRVVNLTLTTVELAAIKTYVDIIYPARVNSRYNIGEISLIQGRDSTGSFGSEIREAQPAYFVLLDVVIDTSKDLNWSLDLGGMIPLVVSTVSAGGLGA